MKMKTRKLTVSRPQSGRQSVRQSVRLVRVLHLRDPGKLSADSDPVKILKSQHRMVEDLFDQMRAHPRRRAWLFDDLLSALAIHADIEEKLVYPAVQERTNDEDYLFEAVEEHLTVKRVLSDLMDLEATDPSFMPKVEVLRSLVQQHVKMEEKHILPKVERLFTRDELSQMAEQMAEMEHEMRGGQETQMRELINQQKDEPATLHNEAQPQQ